MTEQAGSGTRTSGLDLHLDHIGRNVRAGLMDAFRDGWFPFAGANWTQIKSRSQVTVNQLRRRQIDLDLDRLMSKHLTRYFDPGKTIPKETLQQLLRFLRSTPSSVNVQPNHFYVLATPEGKQRLADSLGQRFQDNAEKIVNASHTIILTTRADVPDNHLEAVFAKEKADGRFPDPSKQERWESMTRDFLNLRIYGHRDLNHWMEKQTYMAVGLTMMAAAELGVEATPLEGFDPAGVDKAFKIRETGHSTTVLLALGYPDPDRTYTNPISRFDIDQLFTFI